MFETLLSPPERDCPSCGRAACSWDAAALLSPPRVALNRLLARLVRRVIGVRLCCRHCHTRFADAVELPRVVVGYHGCHRAFAEALVGWRVRPESWAPSRNDYDWLGEGVYFWEYAPGRAWQWARQRHGDDAAVVLAEIELGKCLNLADPAYSALLSDAYQATVNAFEAMGENVPVNAGRDLKLRRLDKAVIDRFTRVTDRPDGPHYQTVRRPFEEGDLVYPGGLIRSQSHVQIPVRDRSCIRPPIHRVRPKGGVT